MATTRLPTRRVCRGFARLNRWLRGLRSDGLIVGDGEGMAVADAAWDTLFVLDGCRYDAFAAAIDRSGELSTVTSRGATSMEFLEANFPAPHHDVVYVSANPYTARLPVGTFHDLIPAYERWDEDLQTVPPETMNELVGEAHERYPDKRIVAHYMQPHYPFLGERGREIDHRGYAPDGDYAGMESWSIWTQLQAGTARASRREVVAAYYENLRLVLGSIDGLLEDIDGKVVLTSDHGNLLGERLAPLPLALYGHYGGLHVPELVSVPWFELPHDGRRETTSEAPVSRPATDEEVISERLRALGYHE